MNEITIPTWTMFGAHGVTIEVFEHDCPEHGTFYQSGFCFHLDDGKEVNEDVNQQKWVSILTEVYDNDPQICALKTLESAIPTFGDALATTGFVVNIDGDIVEEINLENLYSLANASSEAIN